jgi:pimeloyl-ACP methyl ester carboxylesterase/UDP:flavonoid glycosyltransferase YjiC (YdhE family)
VITETGARARTADVVGRVRTADGLTHPWEVHGDGPTSIVFLPPNPISHSRLWKAQLHYLARRHRVVVYDGRGNGEADSPDPAGIWEGTWRADDCLAVLDATDTDRAVLVGICGDGVRPSIQIAAAHPERVLGLVAIGTGIAQLAPTVAHRRRAIETFTDVFDDPQGWEKYNEAYIRSNYRGFLEFFFGEMFPEPHSEKHVEDAVAYGLDGPVDVLLMDEAAADSKEETLDLIGSVRCPVLVVHGDRDNCQGTARALALAELTDADVLWIEGAGHIPQARHPVVVNRAIDEFAQRFAPATPARRTWLHPAVRTKRALLVSSPIGLGHAWRDVAVARELRRLVPGLDVQWLAQPPVTTLLAACGEVVHPASEQLASEAAAVDAEAGEHELHAFQMLRRLDEVFVANFMVFDDLVREEQFDVWIADEAWEIDYFLHENPERKRAPYVWMTDFIGVVPMPSGGEREAFLAADWNAQMVDHVARVPSLRDVSIFIGEPEDVVDAPLGPGLPSIPAWTGEHFAFAGYITGFEPDELADREALRRELRYDPDEQVCVVTSGGSVAGSSLLQRAVAAFPDAKRQVPALRMIVVTGPRIDPTAFAKADGLEIHGYVHQLQRHLAACDVAVAHGGLSTTMELTAASRPFLFFPLKDHFEQNIHVAHRLARHGAGRRMSYDDVSPSDIADALVAELRRQPSYLPIAPGGAARAASLIAPLLA